MNYIKILINGKEYTKLYYRHADLLHGGTLHLDMSPTPNSDRGTLTEDRPYSFSNEQ